jgi:hypothetical protein
VAVYRFRVTDPMNEWFLAIEVDAADDEQASLRAEHMMFARRDVGASGVTITPEPAR